MKGSHGELVHDGPIDPHRTAQEPNHNFESGISGTGISLSCAAGCGEVFEFQEKQNQGFFDWVLWVDIDLIRFLTHSLSMQKSFI